MGNTYQKHGYKITENPDFLQDTYPMTQELKSQLQHDFESILNKKNKKIIGKLTNLVAKYPVLPQIKNFLCTAYSIRGNNEKAFEINEQILAQHPTYFFGKLNKAKQFLWNNEPEKVPSILGESMDIRMLYPERKEFHLSEITSFLNVAIEYFAEIDDLEEAEKQLEILKDIATDPENIKKAESLIFAKRMQIMQEMLRKQNEKRITPEIQAKSLPKQIEKTPKFNHVEIGYLYESGIAIPPEHLQAILELPRETLIQDLEIVLQDAKNRYEYFNEIGWEEDTHHFPLHAIFLLAELQAKESLPKVVELLSYDEEFLEFWFGDHKTETIWLAFYRLGLNNTQALKQFVLQLEITTYIKSAATDALEQIVLHYPERKQEISKVFKDIFERFIAANPDDNFIDSDFLGFAISNCIDAGLKELLPQIKELYEKGYVSEMVCGKYADVEKEFNTSRKLSKTRENFSITALYDNILTTWAGYKDDEDEESIFEEDDDSIWDLRGILPDYNEEPFVNTEPKVGRNDPCPCGSGKKHKKCCGK